MTAEKTAKDGLGIVGFGAAACVACCAGPILAFLGGLGIAGLAATWVIGLAGLAITAVAGVAFLVVRRRRRTVACSTGTADPVPVELLTKADRVTRRSGPIEEATR